MVSQLTCFLMTSVAWSRLLDILSDSNDEDSNTMFRHETRMLRVEQ